MKLRVERINKDLPLPKYQTNQSAGMDLYASIEVPIVIANGEYQLIKTGIKVQLPENYEMQIRPRSGLAVKHGITVLNAPGTIDSDYRGEIGVILINHGKEAFIIKPCDRIAQAVVSKVESASITEVDELEDTERGEGGFGHTGTN